MATQLYISNKDENEWYEIFSANLIKMELKQKGRKGFIIVGPSKNGKTVIMCSLTGLNMQTMHNQDKAITYIEVNEQDPELRKLTHSQGVNSITQIPNTRPFNSQILIVDMPGHSDSHIVRQLCNFYYIREMVLKMNSFHFMLVLNVKNNKLNDVDIKMMQSFKHMFPNSSKYLSICINRYNQKQKQPLMESMRKQLQLYHPDIKDFYNQALSTSSKVVLIPKQQSSQTKKWKCPDQIKRLVINSDYIDKSECKFGQIQYEDRDSLQQFIKNTINFYKESESRIKVLKSILFQFLNQILKACIDNKDQISWVKIIKDHHLYQEFCLNYTSQSEFENIMALQIEQYQIKPQINKSTQTNYVDQNQLCSKLIIQQSFELLKDIVSIEDFFDKKQPQINIIILKKMLKGIECLRTIINQNIFNSSSQNVLQITQKQKKSQKQLTLKDFLNIATLLTIRKFKELNFLLSANKQLQEKVKYLHDEPVTDLDSYQLLITFSHNSIGKKILINSQYQENKSLNIWRFQQSLMQLLSAIFKYFKKEEPQEYFWKKERVTYFIIYYEKSQKIKKIIDLCSFLQKFHPKFEKRQEVISTLIFIAQTLEEVSLNKLAMNIYRDLGHTLSYKRVLLKSINSLQKKKKANQYIKAGKYFSTLLDEENAYQCFQKALELSANPEQRKNISQLIKQLRDRNKLEERLKKYDTKINSWNPGQFIKIISDTKVNVQLVQQQQGSQQNNQQLFFQHIDDIKTLQQIILKERLRIYGLEN